MLYPKLYVCNNRFGIKNKSVFELCYWEWFQKKNQKYQQWHQQQQQEQTEVNDTKNLRNYEQRPPSNMNEFKQKPITEELKFNNIPSIKPKKVLLKAKDQMDAKMSLKQEKNT